MEDIERKCDDEHSNNIPYVASTSLSYRLRDLETDYKEYMLKWDETEKKRVPSKNSTDLIQMMVKI